MAFPRDLADSNPDETREWLEALEYLLDNEGTERANFLLERLSARMAQTGARLPYTITTPYRNTIPVEQRSVHAGRSVHGTTHPFVDSLERARDGDARESIRRRSRRTHRDVFVRGDPLRRRLQLFLSRTDRRKSRRPDLLPGSQLARESTRDRFSKVASTKTTSIGSAAKSMAKDCRRIRIRG